MTQYWDCKAKHIPGCPPQDLEREQNMTAAASLLRRGGLVAFPTETVYGLGADARSTDAVERIFAAKGRPADNPLIVHIAELDELGAFVQPPSPLALRLMQAFWPGPLTMVLSVRPGVLSPRVTAGLDTVGVRMPDHPLALQLIRAAGCPVAGPSANRSGRPSPTSAAHVLEDLDGRIDGVLDGGPTGIGVESTVVELVTGEDGAELVRILRPGGVTREQLQHWVDHVEVDGEGDKSSPSDPTFTPRSPGLKYTHYAPEGSLTVIQGEPERMLSWIRAKTTAVQDSGLRTGWLTFDDHVRQAAADVVVSCGDRKQPEEMARRLYAALRQMDEQQVQVIYAEACPENGIGAAVLNRILKASGGRFVQI